MRELPQRSMRTWITVAAIAVLCSACSRTAPVPVHSMAPGTTLSTPSKAASPPTTCANAHERAYLVQTIFIGNVGAETEVMCLSSPKILAARLKIPGVRCVRAARVSDNPGYDVTSPLELPLKKMITLHRPGFGRDSGFPDC